MTYICPHCGSREVVIFPDMSGHCRRCLASFIRATDQDTAPQQGTVSPGQSAPNIPSVSPSEESVAQSPPWRKSYSSSETVTPGPAPTGSYPVDYWRDLRGDTRDSFAVQREKKVQMGGLMAYVGGILLILAPVMSFLALQALASSEAGYQVSYDELIGALSQTTLGSLICAGIFINFTLGFVAIGLGYGLRSQSGGESLRMVALAAIVVGVIGTVISGVVVGGIIGSAGGVLVVVGGSRGLSRG